MYENFLTSSFSFFLFDWCCVLTPLLAPASLHFMVSSIALPVICSCALCECVNSYLILVPIYHKLSWDFNYCQYFVFLESGISL